MSFRILSIVPVALLVGCGADKPSSPKAQKPAAEAKADASADAGQASDRDR
jgi:hypothetical protein